MTRRYRESKTSASRRALLPIVGAIPLAIAVACSTATGDAAARPSVPAPAPFEQLWTGPVQPGVAPRAIDTSATQGPGRGHYGVTAPVLATGGMPGGYHAVRRNHRMIPHAAVARAITWQNPHAPAPMGAGVFGIPAPRSVPDTMLDQAKTAAAAAKTSLGGGLHSVDTSYSDRVTGLTVGDGTAGAVIGAAVAGIPGAVVGAVPGAIIGGAIGAIAGGITGGVAIGIPTLGVGAPLGAAGGALAGAGVGAAVGAVIGGVTTAIPTGIVGGVAGYALGAATGTGIGSQS